MRYSIKPSYAGVAIALVLGLLILGYVVGNQASRADAEREIAGIKEQLDSLKLQQATLQDAYRGGSLRRRATSIADYGHFARPLAPEQKFTPEEALLSMQGEKQQLDQAFASEPVNPAWAGKAATTVQDALVNVASQPGFPIPDDARVDCRSHSCRIALTLADSGESGQISDWLLADISGLLPQAQLVELPSSDGMRIELYIYATTAPPPT